MKIATKIRTKSATEVAARVRNAQRGRSAISNSGNRDDHLEMIEFCPAARTPSPLSLATGNSNSPHLGPRGVTTSAQAFASNYRKRSSSFDCVARPVRPGNDLPRTAEVLARQAQNASQGPDLVVSAAAALCLSPTRSRRRRMSQPPPPLLVPGPGGPSCASPFSPGAAATPPTVQHSPMVHSSSSPTLAIPPSLPPPVVGQRKLLLKTQSPGIRHTVSAHGRTQFSRMVEPHVQVFQLPQHPRQPVLPPPPPPPPAPPPPPPPPPPAPPLREQAQASEAEMQTVQSLARNSMIVQGMGDNLRDCRLSDNVELMTRFRANVELVLHSTEAMVENLSGNMKLPPFCFKPSDGDDPPPPDQTADTVQLLPPPLPPLPMSEDLVDGQQSVYQTSTDYISVDLI